MADIIPDTSHPLRQMSANDLITDRDSVKTHFKAELNSRNHNNLFTQIDENKSVPAKEIVEIQSVSAKDPISSSEIHKKFEELQQPIYPDTKVNVQWEHEVKEDLPLTEEEIQEKLKNLTSDIKPHVHVRPEITSFLQTMQDMGTLQIYNAKGKLILNEDIYKMVSEDLKSEVNERGCLFYYTKPEVEFTTYTLPPNMNNEYNLLYIQANNTYTRVKEYTFCGKTIHVDLPAKKQEDKALPRYYKEDAMRGRDGDIIIGVSK